MYLFEYQITSPKDETAVTVNPDQSKTTPQIGHVTSYKSS